MKGLEQKCIDAYVPDSNLARWLNRGGRLRQRANAPAHRRMRRKLHEPAGRMIYQRRNAIVVQVIRTKSAGKMLELRYKDFFPVVDLYAAMDCATSSTNVVNCA